MAIDIDVMGSKARLKISAPFDSNTYPDFKRKYEPLIDNKTVQLIEVDISALDYIDSGALGMLVLLNERAKNTGKTMTLVSVPGKVADVLKIANVDKLFSIYLPSGVKLDMGK